MFLNTSARRASLLAVGANPPLPPFPQPLSALVAQLLAVGASLSGLHAGLAEARGAAGPTYCSRG